MNLSSQNSFPFFFNSRSVAGVSAMRTRAQTQAGVEYTSRDNSIEGGCYGNSTGDSYYSSKVFGGGET
jgi:hypothetical protein